MPIQQVNQLTAQLIYIQSLDKRFNLLVLDHGRLKRSARRYFQRSWDTIEQVPTVMRSWQFLN